MKLNHVVKTLCFLFLSIVVPGCQETTDLPPGVSIDSGEITTFAGDTIVLRSTVSDELGIEKISIECAEWSINKVIDLSENHPRVFNVDELILVPLSAGLNFNLELVIEVTSISGKITEKKIPITYLPDTQAPIFNSFSPEVSVNFDTEVSSGIWNFNLILSDNRGLLNATLDVPDLNYSKTVTLTGKTGVIADQITFTSMGNYQATLSASDISGNVLVKNFDVVVMGVEPEDPISNYEAMYCIIADDNPDNYIIGYYKPMTKSGDYMYEVRVYADKANAKIAFVPTRSVSGDYFGVSPYVSTKLLNKRDYVQPINLPSKGYYNVSIDILNKTFNVTSWTPTGTNTYLNQVCMFANNDISWGAWVASPVMTHDGDNQFVARGVIPITAASDVIVQWFCFATSNWSMTWRPDGDTPDMVYGWYAYAGNGKSLNITSAGPGNYPVIFDMAPTIGTNGMWVVIKKP